MNKQPGILGRKIGMTQFFDENHKVVPCTVVEAGPCTVIQVKNNDSDGYSAIQLGFDDQKAHRINKPMMGHLAKASATPKKFIREIRLEDSSAYTAGQTLTLSDVLKAGDKIDVTGRSKGSGFSGVMKKFHFKGFIRSHGTHEFFRHGGSIGTRLTPGMVNSGTKMPGQHGNARATIQNLTLARVDAERNLLFIRGGIPGPNGGYVIVRTAVK